MSFKDCDWPIWFLHFVAHLSRLCRSKLAREGIKDNALIQTVRVIVDVHREQARSYKAVR
ncbi:MAG: hypothetical protein ACRES5_18250 [Pseudomonas sp.]